MAVKPFTAEQKYLISEGDKLAASLLIAAEVALGVKEQQSATMKATLAKPCTVDDGLTVFRNPRAMAEAIGQSRTTGSRQPSFRFLTPTEEDAWRLKMGYPPKVR